MKPERHRFITITTTIIITLLLLACSAVQDVYAAEKTVQINIPGCSS